MTVGKKNGALGLLAITLIAATVWAGPEWVETTDAGSLPADAQPTLGTGTPGTPVTKITGRLGDSTVPPTFGEAPAIDLHDMYILDIANPTTFYATTINFYGGSAEFDSRLWLYKIDGTGMLANDDNFEPIIGLTGGAILVDGSLIGNTANDPTATVLTEPGLYLLAITTHHSSPESADGPIFFFDPKIVAETSSADGAGAGLPIEFWEYFPDTAVTGPFPIGGDYEIAMSGVVSVSGVLTANMDIKPGGCPNSFNRVSNGVLPVAICGTADFDVNDIDLDKVVISRADGIGGSTGPNDGPPGPHSTIGDTATPFEGDECDCHDLDGDGFNDLNLKFKSQNVVDACLLNDLPAGALVRMKVSGELLDGTEFEAFDCLRLVPPGTPPGQAVVSSTVKGAWINISPLDLQLDGGGFAKFERTYPQTTILTLTAQEMPGQVFQGWRVNGSKKLRTGTTLTYTINGTVQTIEAVYVPMLSTSN